MKHNLLNKTKMCSLKQEEERKTQTRRRKNVGLSGCRAVGLVYFYMYRIFDDFDDTSSIF